MNPISEFFPIADMCLRLLVAAFVGAIIGYEREVRAKGAGVRTHVLVALGSCLFMLISQYGFEGATKFDAARVAAGVVSGIGFLGGGLIIKKDHVSGLTTAAGLWVTSAIGLGLGGGLYAVSCLCAFLVLLVMEGLHFYTIKMGYKELHLVFSAADEQTVIDTVKSFGKQLQQFSISKKDGRYTASVQLLLPKREFKPELLRLEAIKDVDLEVLE